MLERLRIDMCCCTLSIFGKSGKEPKEHETAGFEKGLLTSNNCLIFLM